MAPIALQAVELTKIYGETPVVDRVSFEVSSSEIFGLLGPNGAGKTTTIKILAGLIRPTSGGIRVLGEDLTRAPATLRRHLGHVYAGMSFYPQLSGAENLRFFGQFYGLGRRSLRERIEQMLEFAGLAAEPRKPVGTYSQGMKQRLGVAKALLHDPEVLLFDEAAAGIDVEGANRLRGLVYSLRAQGKTILTASHGLDEIELICDRIGLLDGGKLLVLGSPQEIKSRLKGILYKFLIHIPHPIRPSDLSATRTWFLGDSSVVIADRDVSSSLRREYGTSVIERVEPTLEEAFLWILMHPESVQRPD